MKRYTRPTIPVDAVVLPLPSTDNHVIQPASCPGDGASVCSVTNVYSTGAVTNDNQHFKSEKTLSSEEFKSHIIKKLGVAKGDVGATDYIQERYQEYLKTGKVEVTGFGLHMHKGAGQKPQLTMNYY